MLRKMSEMDMDTRNRSSGLQVRLLGDLSSMMTSLRSTYEAIIDKSAGILGETATRIGFSTQEDSYTSSVSLSAMVFECC
mmetsp:Transcript_30017/g.49835  ORF Transcript_30017/g.49835 Transcript_30017/m.49835 type:complete len:80 (+) Transcript_30017:195-434(+)